jgi:hypothetical protein
VIQRLEVIEQTISKIVQGEKPLITFSLSPEFTPQNTLLAYSWILLCTPNFIFRDIQFFTSVNHRQPRGPEIKKIIENAELNQEKTK